MHSIYLGRTSLALAAQDAHGETGLDAYRWLLSKKADPLKSTLGSWSHVTTLREQSNIILDNMRPYTRYILHQMVCELPF